jgi:hypothetical protein
MVVPGTDNGIRATTGFFEAQAGRKRMSSGMRKMVFFMA